MTKPEFYANIVDRDGRQVTAIGGVARAIRHDGWSVSGEALADAIESGATLQRLCIGTTDTGFIWYDMVPLDIALAYEGTRVGFTDDQSRLLPSDVAGFGSMRALAACKLTKQRHG